MLSPPAAKIGAARREARNPKSIVLPLRVIWVVLGFGLVALLGVGYTTGGLLTYGYPTVVVVVLGAGFVGGFLRASAKDAASRLLAEKIKRAGQYNIALPVQGGRYVNVPNPFRGTLVLGGAGAGAGAGKTYLIGEPFLEQFIQRGIAGTWSRRKSAGYWPPMRTRAWVRNRKDSRSISMTPITRPS